MAGTADDGAIELSPLRIAAASTIEELAALLRQLRRRDARDRGDSPLTYRELAAKTGWAHGIIGDYFSGRTLPPTDRFDILVGLLGASAQEVGALATARDRVEEGRRKPRSAADAAPVVPRELPMPVPGFTGRAAQLSHLDELLDTARTVVVVISGTAGVGKTALVVHWANRVADRFPDGCLYVDLRGFGPGEPVRPEDALTGFLRGLGVPGADLPLDAGELAARYRTLLAGRRMLIMLDNAGSAEQVRPLLPGSLSCFALVTSRDQLAGLVARDGAERVDLDLLPDHDAVALLRSLVGARAAAQPAATADLAARCVRLPLALRIAAEVAASRPSATVAALVAELGDQPRTLDLLEAGGDPATAIRQVFSWSYRRLSASAARCFRLLGLHPGVDFDVPSVAALAGLPPGEAHARVEELTRAYLVQQTRPGRYAMHDLLRAYAREQLGEDDPAADRLLEHYVSAAAAAVDTLYPVDRQPGATPPPGRTAPGDALDWLTAELPAMVALSARATRSGRSDFPVRLSAALSRFLDRTSHFPEGLAIHGDAAAVAGARAEPAHEAAALRELGQIHYRLGRLRPALDQLNRALEISRSAGDTALQTRTLNSIATVYDRLGQYEAAVEHFQQALDIDRRIGDRAREGRELGNLGIEYAQLGRYRAAVDHFEQALLVADELGDRYGEGNALTNLGMVHCSLGDYPQAIAELRRALDSTRAIGDRSGEGRVLTNLGMAHTRLGAYTEARDCLERALHLHRAVAGRADEAEALTYFGELHQRTGDHVTALAYHRRALALAQEISLPGVACTAHDGAGRALRALDRLAEATAHHEQAVELATRIGDRLQQAGALDGLAWCRHDAGEHDEARGLWQRALTIYTELGVPEADRVRGQLRG
ncbi:ATP-binding protein [Actinophytocola sp.]|uniref:ATP-binding protein n=1 Tax=Actinophytocola sp. TaxID=1872138 RepID=UPI002D7EEA77|nr:tetratricopeptide repeat protein [Actinophytocola sp.]HET9137886.1 tetratricopeptide repeat protein [Actinophytocola sp.]